MTGSCNAAPADGRDAALPGWLDAAARRRPGAFVRTFGPPCAVATEQRDPDHGGAAADALGTARREGYAAGLAEGAERAAAAAAAERAAAATLQLAFARLDAAAAAELAEHLMRTVARLCGDVLPTATFDGEALRRRCEAAAQALGESPSTVTLRLNPHDVALLPSDWLEAWTVAPDGDLPRGALRLQGPDGGLADGPEEWARCLREALSAC